MCGYQEQKVPNSIEIPVEEYAKLQDQARILQELLNQQTTEPESFQKG